MKSSRIRIIGGISGLMLGVAVALMPIPGLSAQATTVLGVLLGAIVWWIADVLTEYATALVMALLFVTVCGIPASTAFSSFSSPTWWLLLAAFGLGLGMKESGLLRRMALAVLNLFPRRYGAQVFALMAAGTVVGPLIPSMSAKTAMLAPLACEMSDSMGYARKSREADGMFLAMLVGVRNIGPAAISASVIGYALLALYPVQVQQRFTMLNWFLAALPWFVVVTLVNYLLIVAIYGRGSGRARVAAKTEEIPPCGRWTPAEKRMLGIILVTVVLWATESLHGIPAFATAGMALCVCVAVGIVDRTGFRAGINWDSLVFVGVVLGLSPVFQSVGIDSWIVTLLGPALQDLAFSPYLFVVGIGVVTVLARFVVVSELAFINIFLAFMVPLSVALGIDPWVVGFATYALVNPWFTRYQNPVYLAAFYAVDGKMVAHAEMARFCLLYVATCLAGLVVSVPYWQAIGIYYL